MFKDDIPREKITKLKEFLVDQFYYFCFLMKKIILPSCMWIEFIIDPVKTKEEYQYGLYTRMKPVEFLKWLFFEESE